MLIFLMEQCDKEDLDEYRRFEFELAAGCDCLLWTRLD